MHDFPEESTLPGMMVVDFTHVLNKDVNSDNYKRWQTRLKTIEDKYGSKGSDEFWSAPTYRVTDYVTAREKAKLDVTEGKIKVTLPKGTNGAALTLKINGVNELSQFNAPKGGLVHRKDDTVWVTLPEIGEYGLPAPEPTLKLAYSGENQESITFKQPMKVAAIRLLQTGGEPAANPEATLIIKDGTEKSIDHSESKKFVQLKSRWGQWYLIPVLPLHQPIEAIGVKISADNKAFKTVEIWTVD